MAKLQKITRSNMTTVYSVNIPNQVIEEIGWEKGQEIDISVKKLNDGTIIVLRKKE